MSNQKSNSELKAFDSFRIYWAAEQVERVAGDIDELHLDDNLFYIKSEADKVIAELKDKVQMHDFFWEGCGFDRLGFRNAISVRDYCDDLKRQNDVLEQECRVAHSKVLDMKCELWRMTAEWADAMGLASCNIAAKFMCRENFEVGENYRKRLIEKYRHRQVVFCKYADYCRKKMESLKLEGCK